MFHLWIHCLLWKDTKNKGLVQWLGGGLRCVRFTQENTPLSQNRNLQPTVREEIFFRYEWCHSIDFTTRVFDSFLGNPQQKVEIFSQMFLDVHRPKSVTLFYGFVFLFRFETCKTGFGSQPVTFTKEGWVKTSTVHSSIPKFVWYLISHYHFQNHPSTSENLFQPGCVFFQKCSNPSQKTFANKKGLSHMSLPCQVWRDHRGLGLGLETVLAEQIAIQYRCWRLNESGMRWHEYIF